MVWTKKLHLSFFFLDDTMPASIAEHIAKLKAQNPEFEVKVWGPKEARALLVEKYPQFVEKFDSFPHAIMKSDFSRYAILHAEGGIYMDIDYVLKKPLDHILAFLDANPATASKSVFVNETPNNVLLRRLSNSMMIARQAGDSFWLHVMELAGNGTGVSSHRQVLTGTGPRLMDRAFGGYPKKYMVGVLPTRYFSPCSVCSRGSGCGKPAHVLAYHKADGCWNNDSSDIYNVLLCNMWWMIATVLLVIVIIVLAVLLAQRRV